MTYILIGVGLAIGVAAFLLPHRQCPRCGAVGSDEIRDAYLGSVYRCRNCHEVWSDDGK